MPNLNTSLPKSLPEPLSHPALERHVCVRHGFFTRQGGVSSGLYASLNGGLGSRDDRQAVMENRARAAAILGVAPASLLTVYQEHSPHVVSVRNAWSPNDAPHADAMVSREPGLALAILTADCAPVLFADDAAGVIGAAHAGWKGALGGVLEQTVQAMQALGAAPKRITAVIGPTIAQPSYEVGPEFRTKFMAADAANQTYFSTPHDNGHCYFDLPGFIRSRLEILKLGEIADVERDTYKEPELFFSYRRSCHLQEQDYGRLMSAIALVHSS